MTEDGSTDEYFKTVLEVVKQAGILIRQAFTTSPINKKVSTKNGYADLVTETDRRVEDMIIHSLSSRYPHHRFIGEEMMSDQMHCNLTDKPTWIIDPIDGTTNFVHKFPHVAISVALLMNKQVVIGIVYNPLSEQLYTARPGCGAYCNDRKLHVTTTTELSQALVCAEFGSSRDPVVLDSKFRSIHNVVARARGVRSIGSAALHMCLVAAGELDAHFTYGIHIWDMAAGDLIVREAGGVVHDTTGGPVDFLSRQVLCASNSQLAQEIASLIEHIDLPRD